jgi:FKBP-type peptidyl-prolyl cis-trans isomerase SlyD
MIQIKPFVKINIIKSLGEIMSLLIGDKLVVSIHYKLTDNDGKVLDNSESSDPLTYLHGAGNIIPGLEKALVGKVQGATLQVKVEPAEGYGEFVQDQIQKVKREAFQGVESIEVGMAFQAQTPEGAMQHIVVKKVDGDDITIDANHPLAGVTLNFDVEIVGIREATKEELDHGHVH